MALSLLALSSLSQAAGSDVLKKVDSVVNNWKTLEYKYRIVTTKPGEGAATIKMRVRMRVKNGNNMQMVDILEPRDMVGTRILTISQTKRYIYLPAYKKIRRIASHVTEQGMLGTSLSEQDMTLTRYTKFYNAKTLSESGSTATLSLTAKTGSAPYPKLELVVDKSKWVPLTIRYFNAKGANIKTETRSRYKCKGGHCSPGLLKMVDHRNSVTSTLSLLKYKRNIKIKKKVFTKRYLQS